LEESFAAIGGSGAAHKDGSQLVAFRDDDLPVPDVTSSSSFKNPKIGRRLVGRLDRHERAVPCKGDEP
jgi:hypothetical protein